MIRKYRQIPIFYYNSADDRRACGSFDILMTTCGALWRAWWCTIFSNETIFFFKKGCHKWETGTGCLRLGNTTWVSEISIYIAFLDAKESIFVEGVGNLKIKIVWFLFILNQFNLYSFLQVNSSQFIHSLRVMWSSRWPVCFTSTTLYNLYTWPE